MTISEALERALQHHLAGRLPAAEQIYRQVLRADPHQTDALHLLGVIANQIGQHDLAIEYIRQAIALKGDAADFHYNLGEAYDGARRNPDATASYRRALALNPDFVKAHNNLGNALKDQGELDEAVACLQRAIQLKPDYAEAHSNLGVAFRDLGKMEEAIASVRRALALQPDLAGAHHNLGMFLLRCGQYKEGWPEYEHRLRCAVAPREFSKPPWQGERAEGKTIMIHHEQGLGDTIQFARYAPLVRERSGAQRVILETQPELARLFTQSGGFEAEIIPGRFSKESELPHFDCYAPLLSLPLRVGRFEPLPMSHAYLRADPALREAWRDRLGARTAIRVGLVCSGNSENRTNRLRSLDPRRLRPLLQIDGVQAYSLQLGPPNSDTESLKEAGLIDLTMHLKDFADTAALIAELDLIISVDTAVAHLAGAMAHPVWTLLPAQAEWRWGLTGATTPWYPTMRLFRQPTAGDWESTVRDVATNLKSQISNLK